MHKQVTVKSAPPKARKVAKILGVSTQRVDKIVHLMDSLAVSDRVVVTPRTGKIHIGTEKAHVAPKKKK